MFEGKTVLVTGGTGSVGRAFIKRVLTEEYGIPRKIIVFSRDEVKQYYMRQWYSHYSAVGVKRLEFIIGDIRNYASVCSAIKNVDIIVNAAALKQVPICEYFPEQAVLTNCIGLQNIVRALNENSYPVETVIVISTDKACKPVSVMGMTKAIQERIAIMANVTNCNTCFACVRYGNIMVSRGSVIPLFRRQIDNGDPVTVTSSEMTRFMFTMDQAVDIVLEAIKDAKPGEVYVPKIVSFRLIDIAKAMIGSGKNEVKIVGTRPGEKIHEVIISEEECSRVIERSDYYVITPMLPELSDVYNKSNTVLTEEYNSADVTVSLSEVSELLKGINFYLDDIG